MDSLPSKAQILDWLADSGERPNRGEIARAFGLRGPARRELAGLLREMEAEGLIAPGRAGRRGTPPVTLLRVVGVDEDGDAIAEPAAWSGEGSAPRIRLTATDGAAPGPGDRLLARVTDGENGPEARVIRKIGDEPERILGIYRDDGKGGAIEPVDHSGRKMRVSRADAGDARDGELVLVLPAGSRRSGMPQARIVERLGDPSAPRAVSLIAIHEHGIPTDFPDAAVAEATALSSPGLGPDRIDLRHLPFVTIDPPDARDHDDAVFARADEDPGNRGGHEVHVAIADVAHFVAPGGALDRAAWERGNSTYFADRVVPMLPERLSGDLCSLHEDVDRAAMVLCMRIDAEGRVLDHRLDRALIASRASLAYDDVQDARDGAPNARLAPLMETIVDPLYAAWDALRIARSRRTPLALDLPERRIVLDDDGKVASVGFKERRDAHRLIEDFMVLANAVVAEALLAARTPSLYRVHEDPDPKKLDALRDVARAAGFPLAKGQRMTPQRLNRLLEDAAGTPHAETLSMAVLRAMPQAYYAPENLGHFGLDLRAYTHFTSPIRRYADLVVHRALAHLHGWSGAAPEEGEALARTAEQISMTERRSMEAERDTADRYLAAYLADRIGAEFAGVISGVQRFGLFVKLDGTGADGLVPVGTLGREYHRFDREAQTLEGVETGRVFELGQRVEVRLVEAAPMTGGLVLELLGAETSGATTRGRRRGAARKPGRGKATARRRGKAAGGAKRGPRA